MNAILEKVIEAHGGLPTWNRFDKVEAAIVSGGGFFPLKGFAADARRAHTRGPDRRPIQEMLMVYINIRSQVQLTEEVQQGLRRIGPEAVPALEAALKVPATSEAGLRCKACSGLPPAAFCLRLGAKSNPTMSSNVLL